MSFDDSVEAAQEWANAADPTPTFPMLLDRELLLSELYGIYNVPSVIWIDEDDRIARAPVIAPGDDMFKDFTNIDSSVHHDQLRAWVRDGTLPPQSGHEQVMLPTDDEQLPPRATGRRVSRPGGPVRRGRAALRARRRTRTHGLDDSPRHDAAPR